LGDVIPYIYCLGADGQTAKTAQPDKARHPDELRRGENEFKIGVYIIVYELTLSLTVANRL
jgi:hypothetical protein